MSKLADYWVIFVEFPENNIKTSPFIKEAIVIGDDRKFLSALIGIEYDIVSNWALRKNIAHTTYRNLSENEEVQNLIWDEIQKDMQSENQMVRL